MGSLRPSSRGAAFERRQIDSVPLAVVVALGRLVRDRLGSRSACARPLTSYCFRDDGQRLMFGVSDRPDRRLGR